MSQMKKEQGFYRSQEDLDKEASFLNLERGMEFTYLIAGSFTKMVGKDPM